MSGVDIKASQPRLPTATDMRKKSVASLKQHMREPLNSPARADIRKLASAELARRGVKL